MQRLTLAVLMLALAAVAAAQQAARYAGDRDQITMVVMRAATTPQPFTGTDGSMHLVYEVEVTSARPQAVQITSFQVLDPETGRVLWSAADAMMKEAFQLLDRTPADTLLGSQTGAFWLAVAAGTVVSVLDGLPDRFPGMLPPDTTIQNVTGNHVILDIGDGLYAFYAHLKSGAIKVKVGERVKRGQVLALLGNSGNTSAPHLHIHVMDALSPLAANKVPYVIDRFTKTGVLDDFEPDPNQHPLGQKLPVKRTATGPRTNSFPMDGDVIDF